MTGWLDNILYETDKAAYQRVRTDARSFRAQYAPEVPREEIFRVMQNFVRRSGYALEILRYPIRDLSLKAFALVRDGQFFCTVNTCIPLNEQLFAAACELYPIYCCLTRKNGEFLKNGSLYTSASASFEAERAFAAMVLAREAELIDRMELYGIDRQYIGLRDVVRLMDCFGLPYRAMVLRLYECGMLERNRAGIFLERERDAEQFIEDSGLARRWMMDTGNYIDFGSLPALMKENRDRGNISEREYIAGKGELDRLRRMLLETKSHIDKRD